MSLQLILFIVSCSCTFYQILSQIAATGDLTCVSTAWTATYGAWDFNKCQIENTNELSGSFAWIENNNAASTTWEDYTVEMIMTPTPGYATGNGGLAFHIQTVGTGAASGNYYGLSLLSLQLTPIQAAIGKWSGTYSVKALFDVPGMNHIDGNSYHLKVEINNIPRIKVWVNNTYLGQWTDTTSPYTYGSVGARNWNLPQTITDFCVNGCTTPNPTPSPTHFPTPSPTSIPSESPTIIPTMSPTVIPTITPTEIPTVTPSSNPSKTPTSAPTRKPTFYPTLITIVPTRTPTNNPSITPTLYPTKTPSFNPSFSPTNTPTLITYSPTKITDNPSFYPTKIPTTPSPTLIIYDNIVVPTFTPTNLEQNMDEMYSSTQGQLIIEMKNDGQKNRILSAVVIVLGIACICCIGMLYIVVKKWRNKKDKYNKDANQLKMTQIESGTIGYVPPNITKVNDEYIGDAYVDDEQEKHIVKEINKTAMGTRDMDVVKKIDKTAMGVEVNDERDMDIVKHIDKTEMGLPDQSITNGKVYMIDDEFSDDSEHAGNTVGETDY